MNLDAAMDTAPHKLLLLSESDNVLVALGPLAIGVHRVSDGSNVAVGTPVTLGHKIARQTIEAGEKVLKYGVCIGSASIRIKAGEHVHVHNMQSDYTPTHALKETQGGTDA